MNYYKSLSNLFPTKTNTLWWILIDFFFHICNLYHGDIQNKKKPTIIYEKKNSKKIKIYLKSDLLRKLIMCYIVYDCLVKFHISLNYCGRRLVRTFCMEMEEKNSIFYSVLSSKYIVFSFGWTKKYSFPQYESYCNQWNSFKLMSLNWF